MKRLKTIGSGQRQIDECKAENCRDAIKKMAAAITDDMPVDVREPIEARIGRQAIALLKLEAGLETVQD